MNITCTRAWYATWTKCACRRCKVQTRRLTKLSEAGRWKRPSTRKADAVIAGMIDRRWSVVAIASACRISESTAKTAVTAIRAGKPHRLSAGVIYAIVNHGAPTRGTVPAIPSQRKLQALARIGHTAEKVAQNCTAHPTTLARVRRGATPTIEPGLAEEIDQAWRALCLTRGTSTRAALAAERNGWFFPLEWDDIDDPNAEPSRPARARTEPRAVELSWLGYGTWEIAEMLRVKRADVVATLERAEREVA